MADNSKVFSSQTALNAHFSLLVRGSSICFEQQTEDGLRSLVKIREPGRNEQYFLHRERLKGIKNYLSFLALNQPQILLSTPAVPSIKKWNSIGPVVHRGPILHLGYQNRLCFLMLKNIF